MTMVGGGKIYHRRYRRLPSAICCPPLQLNSHIRRCRLSLAAALLYHGRLNRTPLSITATFKHHCPSLLLNGRHILLPPAAAICRCLDLIVVSFFAPPPSQRPSLPPLKDATAIKRPRLPPPSKSCFVFYCRHQTPPPARHPPSAVRRQSLAVVHCRVHQTPVTLPPSAIAAFIEHRRIGGSILAPADQVLLALSYFLGDTKSLFLLSHWLCAHSFLGSYQSTSIGSDINPAID